MKRRLVLAGILAAMLAVPVIGKSITPTVRAEEEEISAEDVVPFEEVEINETNFPDEIFRQFVLDYVDKDKDKKLSDSEIAQRTHITFYSEKNMKSLKGIEYLTALKELTIQFCHMTSLDVSKNKELTKLICFMCEEMTSLDVSGCTALEELKCYHCQLTTLDASKCTKLKSLNCSGSHLASLNVSGCKALEEMDCSANQLASLDASKCTNLKSLNCVDNKLTSLNVSGCTALKELDCTNNKLTSLDVKNSVNLKKLLCENNLLTGLNVSTCTALEELNCTKNLLASLDVTNNANLKILSCGSNQLTDLDVTKNTILDELLCGSNQLTNLDITKNTKLEILHCYENKLTSLDMSKNKLYIVHCYDNQLKSLDLNTPSYILDLRCFANQIQTLNLKKQSYLRRYAYEDGKLSTEPYKNITYYMYAFIGDGYDQGTGYYDYYLAVDAFTNIIPADNNTVGIEIDLSKGDIPYTGSDDLLEAVKALLNKDKHDDLFDSLLDKEHQTMYLDLDRDGNYDVKYFLKGNTFLAKAASCSIDKKIEFTSDQLQDTIYKNITFVFGEHYTVTFDPGEEGKGVMKQDQAFKGDKYVLPDCEFVPQWKGWEFDCWNLGKPGDSVYISADTVIKAKWKETIYSVNVTTDGHGIALASVESGLQGTNVTLQAKPDNGYKFKEWQVVSGGVTIKDNKFTIGTEDVEIKAIFEAIPATPTPTNTPTPKPGDPTPTPKPGDPTPTPKPGDPTPTPIPEKDPSIADFVERLYTIALNRASDPEGKAFWVKEIEDGNRTGGDCAYFFLIESPEFANRGLSDEDFVETLYLTFFDRASEAEGKAFWVGQLKNKTMTRDQVIMGFIDSKEWCNVCATYGVKSGAPTAKAEIASKNAINFATRLYTCCLGREAEEGGLKYWSLALTNLEQTGCSAAKEFFTSEEFLNFKLKDDEYVKRLYTTFMDREPEAGEVAYWTGEIAKGTQTRDSVLAFFGQSEEFTNICKKYGIDRGTM